MLHSDNLALEISNARFITNTVFSPLNYIEATKLSTAAKQDAVALAQVAWVSLSEGISDAKKGRYTWSTVKLYYSAFQAIRARLLYSGTIVFYRHTTPYSLKASPGDIIRKRSGNTHTAVFRIFRESFPSNPVLAQPINGMDALQWIENFRNAASYSKAPITDPEPPREFELFEKKPRAFIARCIDRHSGAAFEPESALIALPFYLVMALDEVMSGGGPESTVTIEKFFVDILANEDLFLAEYRTGLQAYRFPN